MVVPSEALEIWKRSMKATLETIFLDNKLFFKAILTSPYKNANSSQLCIYLKCKKFCLIILLMSILAELKVLKSMDEISLLISEFEKTIANLDSLSTNELLNQSLISKFSGSPALDLYIGRLLLKRTEYLKVFGVSTNSF